jgi:hypothetical protein
MTGLKTIAALLALACLANPARGIAADDAASLRAELDALKTDYGARVSALEARITQLEAAPKEATPAPQAAPQAEPAPVPPPMASPSPAAGANGSASAFNPSISAVLGGTYTSTSRDPDSWHIAGFIPSGAETGPGARSFNLGESEVVLAANVDPYFSATLIASISGENEIGIEEAFLRTLALPSGLTAKAGRFLSGFGYLNEVHAHAWDFVDQPLVYQAFFGGQRAQDGVQLKWLAPTDLFVELGAEAGNGSEFPGTRRNRNGPNGVTLFTHLGGDVGDSASWRAGVSWVDLYAEDRVYQDPDSPNAQVTNSFTGESQTWVIDAVLKWAPNGDMTHHQLKLQGEYLRRTETGTLTYDTTGAALGSAYRSEQSGWYLQGTFAFLPRWRVGARYDALDSGLSGVNPDRITMMLDWSPSEFSRLRAQYAWDDARNDGSTDRQFRLQYVIGIGAHGAHKF